MASSLSQVLMQSARAFAGFLAENSKPARHLCFANKGIEREASAELSSP